MKKCFNLWSYIYISGYKKFTIMEWNFAAFCRCCFQANIFAECFAAFLFCRHGHFFRPKSVFSFFLTQNFSYYVWMIFHNFWCNLNFERRLSLGEVKFPHPPPPVEIDRIKQCLTSNFNYLDCWRLLQRRASPPQHPWSSVFAISFIAPESCQQQN